MSAHRTPPCPYFAECGGCPLMDREYEDQLRKKRKRLAEALDADPEPVTPSPRQVDYRRRVTWHGAYDDEGVRVGTMRAEGQARELVNLPSCLVVHPELNVALESVRAAVNDLVPGEGEFRLEATCDADERVGLVFHVSRTDEEPFAKVARAMMDTGVAAVRVVDDQDKVRFEQGDPRQFVLRPGVHFSLQSFTQVNFEQNEALVGEVLRAAREVDAKRVLDLYSGIGNHALALAPHVQSVLAVESALGAVADARDNAARAGLDRVTVLRSAASAAVRELVKRRERFDVVVLNPTRAGADGVVEHLPRLKARRVIYVSCSPSTLARDLKVLKKADYRLTRATPFDMFCQTAHVETVAVVDRK